MRDRHTRALSAILLAVVTATACGGASRTGAEMGARPAVDEGADFEAVYRARNDSARARFTEADVRFMTGMIGHHAQALVMSALAPARGAGQAVRRLTARIINAQQDEIATMQQWLRDRGRPAPDVEIAGTELVVDGPDWIMHMPGMLTSEQLHELEQASGSEFDRLFLMRMIQHHRGAVTMVHNLFDTDGAAQDERVFRLASDIQVDQITEIARMERMLSAITGAGRAP